MQRRSFLKGSIASLLLGALSTNKVLASTINSLTPESLNVLLYLIQTFGELCLSPIGLSLVGKLSPKRFASLLFGVFFLSNAAGYALSGTLGSIMPATGDKFLKAEKLGINSGMHVIHPITKKKIPVWIGNFVLLDYGTGVVMGVPAHDQRDFEFASKYNLEIPQVISSDNNNELPVVQKGKLINSDKYDGMDSDEASLEIIKDLAGANLGEQLIQFRLRDWGVSRQRYWGCPIPVVYENGEPRVIDENYSICKVIEGGDKINQLMNQKEKVFCRLVTN